MNRNELPPRNPHTAHQRPHDPAHDVEHDTRRGAAPGARRLPGGGEDRHSERSHADAEERALREYGRQARGDEYRQPGWQGNSLYTGAGRLCGRPPGTEPAADATDDTRPPDVGAPRDQDKAHTPDKLRNDKAQWKRPDMPEAEHTAHPDDYERPLFPHRRE